ncbi:Dabb family protein [Deltaproteobacteria bacterium TL4]
MIKHIVMFKLKTPAPENWNKAVSALQGLRGAIETLRDIEVGRNFTESERSYDIVIITHFDNLEGLNTYQDHPKHLPVIQTMRELCSSSVVVDYEI